MFINDRMKNLLERLRLAKHIICFGTGKYSKKLGEYLNEDIQQKILFFVDNDINKQGQSYIIGNEEKRIVSFHELERNEIDNTVFIITCMEYEEVLAQINSNKKFREIECFSLANCIMLEEEANAMEKDIPANIMLTEKPLIPKIIHYCWFGRNPLPDQYKRWMDSWLKYCPDYEIKEWNEDNYDVTKNRYMRQAYELKKWGFVPDYARLDIVYNFGGIYLDTDVEIIKNIDDLLYQQGFAGFEQREYVNLGQGFGARRGLTIIKELRDMYDEIDFIDENGNPNLKASPKWQTEYLLTKGLIANGEFQVVDDLTIYPEKMFGAKNIFTRRIQLKDYTKAIHHYDGSWLDLSVKEKSKKREIRFSTIE